MANVEHLKANSAALRGPLAEELSQPASGFSAAGAGILKFHGMYQQDNRDARQARKQEAQAKSHSFMIRTRIPGGRVTPQQYIAHDDIATQFADGSLRLTTRQDFQLHGVLKTDLRSTLQTLAASLMTSFAACGDVVRNVVCCPYPVADVLEREMWHQVTSLAHHLEPKTQAYSEIWLDGEKAADIGAPEEEPLYGTTYLPRKFKIGVALPWDNCVDILAQDLGFVAVTNGKRIVGYNVYVGGGLGMTHNKPATFPALGQPLAWVTSAQVVPVATAIVEIFRDWGDRENRKHARIKYLVAEKGVEWFRQELSARLGYTVVLPHPITISDADTHLGWHAQDNGLWSLGVYVESGRIRDAETQHVRTAFRRIVERIQPSIRLTADQNILFSDILEAQRGEIDAILQEHGVIPVEHITPIRRRALACPALPTCSLALSEAERFMPALLPQLEQAFASLGLENEAPVVRVTGCPNGCARPYTAEIGIVGRSGDNYVLYLGGSHLGTRLGVAVADLVPSKDIIPTLYPVLVAFRSDRQSDEHFGDFCHRLGAERVRQLIDTKAASDSHPAITAVHPENSQLQEATGA
jgi:sulfite reductase (ferredoxin)